MSHVMNIDRIRTSRIRIELGFAEALALFQAHVRRRTKR